MEAEQLAVVTAGILHTAVGMVDQTERLRIAIFSACGR